MSPPPWQAAALLVSCLGLSLALAGLVIGQARRLGVVDVPNHRSSHQRPTPRAGGVAIVAAFAAGVAAWYGMGGLGGTAALALLGPGLLAAAVGLADDVRSLSVRFRLAVQGLAAVLAVALAPALVPLGGAAGVAVAGLAAVGLVWALNLYNFMDGIDGIAGSEAVFVAGAGAVLLAGPAPDLAVASGLIAAASLGFLAWNWPPAKVFMGDCGSGFLGLTLAVLAILSAGAVPLAAWAILGGLFIADASVTLAVRLLRGERPHEPHRSHAYQHLARRWGGHRPVVLGAWAVNLGWLLPWAWLATARPGLAATALVAALLPLAVAVAWIGAGRPEAACR